jgi:hypothetical protein
MIIQDARTGRTAEVDSENRLTTFSVAQDENKHTNIAGLSDSIYFTVTPAGANDYFFYLKNNGTVDIALTDIRLSSTVATRVFLEVATGTPSYVSESAASVTNRNLGSSKAPTITANYDTNITGLTNGGELLFQECHLADELYHMKPSSTIIIPQGQAVSLKRVAATGLMTVLVSLTVADS